MRFFIPAMTSSLTELKKNIFSQFLSSSEKKTARNQRREGEIALRAENIEKSVLHCSAHLASVPPQITSNRRNWWFGYDCVWTSSTKNWMFFGKSNSVNYMVIGIDGIVSWKNFYPIYRFTCVYLLAHCSVCEKKEKKGEETWKKVEIE